MGHPTTPSVSWPARPSVARLVAPEVLAMVVAKLVVAEPEAPGGLGPVSASFFECALEQAAHTGLPVWQAARAAAFPSAALDMVSHKNKSTWGASISACSRYKGPISSIWPTRSGL